jgi:hypothetical protein
MKGFKEIKTVQTVQYKPNTLAIVWNYCMFKRVTDKSLQDIKSQFDDL